MAIPGDRASRTTSPVRGSMLASFLLLAIAPSHGRAALPTVEPYPRAAYAAASETYKLTAGRRPVDVQVYHDYHYAHLSFDGALRFEVTVPEAIETADVSPRARGVKAVREGRALRFELTQPPGPDAAPAYVVVRINRLPRLVILADPPEPDAPDRRAPGVRDVTAAPYNADPSGRAFATAPIHKAIDDAAAAAGGGTVYVPAGVYKVITVRLKSNVTLYLAPGAVLRAPPDRADNPGAQEVLSATGETGAAVRGRGTIDGSGIALMDHATLENRRRVLVARDCRNLSIEGVTVRDGTTWTVMVEGCEDVTVRNVKVLNHADAARFKIMNDGIDVCSTRRAVVDGCFVMTVDDALCAKSMRRDVETSDVRFTNNVVWTSAAGIKAGMQANGPMRDIRFRNNDVLNARRGIVVETTRGTSLVSRIRFADNRVEALSDTIYKSVAFDVSAGTAPVADVEILSATFDAPGSARPRVHGSAAAAVRDVRVLRTRLGGSPLASPDRLSINPQASDVTVSSEKG